jgi:adenine-specific DNA-methyltransferase
MVKEITTRSGLNRNLGQFFSPDVLVDKCVSLICNENGRLLEPSCGDGAFNKCLSDDSVFIEIDDGVITDKRVLNIDFFDYPENEKFDTIIGNPPYVDNKFINIKHKTGIKVQANLYLYFIEKCFYHLKIGGELIFIAPREFIKLTSARYVNNLLCDNGTITHYFDYGDRRLFNEACPNVCIFRYVKGDNSKITETFDGKKKLLINDGIISFSDDGDVRPLGDFFEIKVGAVSGADKLYENKKGDEFVCSKTAKTGELRKMIYEQYNESLEIHKNVLINRRIKKLGENNWWTWGRPVKFREKKPRIYVNCKTRNKNPFFLNPCDKWDGSVLALFPKEYMNLQKTTEKLNALDWQGMGNITGGRYLLSQKSLKEALIDEKMFSCLRNRRSA